MAGLEGIDASSMDVIDALGGVRYVYDPGDRIARPVYRHTDFVPVARLLHAAHHDEATLGKHGRPGERVVDRVRFGLPVGPRILTNARSDNLASPAWRGMFGKAEHHCLTAVGYVIERKGEASYRIQRADGKPMVVPGLVARRHYTFASTGNEYDDLGHVQLTGDANAHVGLVHDRFVLELPDKAARDLWMDPAATKQEWTDLLVPAPPEAYEMVPIDPDVWTRRNDPDAVTPRGAPLRWDPSRPADKPAQRTLF